MPVSPSGMYMMMAFHRGDLDPDTANRLLTGRLAPDDAPPGYHRVTQLLHDVRTEAAPSTVTDDVLIVAMVDAILSDETAQPKRKHVLTRIVTTKAAAVAVVALSATSAAAATGNLPDAAQDGLARAAQHVGINLPSSANDKARESTDELGPKGADPDATTVPEADTDNTGEIAVTGGDDTTGEPSLPAGDAGTGGAAPVDNHGAVVSETAHTADPEGGKGEEVAPVAQDNHGSEARADHQPENPGNAANNTAGNDGANAPRDNPNGNQ